MPHATLPQPVSLKWTFSYIEEKVATLRTEDLCAELGRSSMYLVFTSINGIAGSYTETTPALAVAAGLTSHNILIW